MNNYSEEKIRYLEMIQNIISRMTSNSFAPKGWTVTLIAGIFALASKDADKQFFLITYIPIILFWILDTYYLQMEKRYRTLYNNALSLDNKNIEMKLEAPMPSWSEKTNCFQIFFSKTEMFFYLPAAALVTLVNLLAVSKIKIF